MGATSGALGVPVQAGLAHRPTNGRSLFVNIGSRAPKSLHEPGRDGAETPPAEQQSSPFVDGWSSLDPIFQDSIELVNGKAPGKHPVIAQIHSKKVGQIPDLLKGIEVATYCQNLLSGPPFHALKLIQPCGPRARSWDDTLAAALADWDFQDESNRRLPGGSKQSDGVLTAQTRRF